MKNLLFAYAKTKRQISCTVTKQLIGAFVFASYNHSTSLIQNFKSLAIFGCCTAWFVFELAGNSYDRFPCNMAQIYVS